MTVKEPSTEPSLSVRKEASPRKRCEMREKYGCFTCWIGEKNCDFR